MAFTYSANASLPTPVETHQQTQDFEDVQGAQVESHRNLEALLTGSQSAVNAGINASVINAGGKPLVLVQLLSAGSIGSIANVINGFPFTLLCESAGSMGIPDAGGFRLASAWVPTTQDTLTLVWDGTNYYEIARSAN